MRWPIIWRLAFRSSRAISLGVGLCLSDFWLHPSGCQVFASRHGSNLSVLGFWVRFQELQNFQIWLYMYLGKFGPLARPRYRSNVFWQVLHVSVVLHAVPSGGRRPILLLLSDILVRNQNEVIFNIRTTHFFLKIETCQYMWNKHLQQTGITWSILLGD